MKFNKTLAAILILLMFLQLLPLEFNISGSDSSNVNVFAAPNSPVNTAIKVSSTSAVSTPSKIITSMSSSSTPSTKLKSTPMNSPVSSPNVSLNLDKTVAEVGDIITANVSINNIINFAGINVCLKYDPNTLQPIEPATKAYTDSTVPGIGNILNNTSYTPFSAAANKISEGLLNFSRLYYNLSTYKMSGKPENSGIVAVVVFKVLKPNVTQISLEKPNSILGNISGTYAYNWDGRLINSGFSIIQPGTINPTGPTCIPTQTPVPTPTFFSESLSTAQTKTSLELQSMAVTLASVTNGKISGYIKPDFDYDITNSSKIFANLKIRITSVGNPTDVKYSTGVGSNGYFEINNINVSSNVDIIISKYDTAGNEIPGYLRRCISDFNIDSTNISFGTQNDPMDIWAGDLNKDGVINTSDQIALAQVFNSFEGDAKYNANADFNKDGVINTADLIILAKHYTATSLSYPSLPNIMIKSGVTYINNGYTLSSNKSFGESVVNSNAVLNLNGKTFTFTGNLTVNGSVNVNKGTINVNGNLIHDSVGTIDVNAGNINITGNLNQSTGTIDINRGTVRVQKNAEISDSGNFVQNGSSIPGKSSTIRINSGKLLVDGNYTIPDTNNNYSRLIMRNAADYVLVGGSFLNYSHVDSSINNNNTPDGDRLKCFTDGVLEVKGDFIQGGNARSFVSSDNHKVILSGTGLQNVNFNSYQNGESCFNLLEITNTGETNGVVFSGNPVTITSLEKCTKIFSNFKLRKLLKPLKTDIVVNGDFIIDNPESGTNIDIGNKNGTKIDVNSHSVTVNGSIIQKGGLLDINHGNLNVNYDLILDTDEWGRDTHPTVKVNWGRIEVGRDFYTGGKEQIDNNGNITTIDSGKIDFQIKGRLIMQEPKDYVLVNGSFYSNSHESYYDSLDSSKQLLKNGTLEVKGNFIQGAIANYVDQNGISRQHTTAANNFPATGNHKVILSGDPSKIQYVTFKNYDDNPSNGSSINILILTNPMSSYVFNPSKVWRILSSPDSKDNITTTTEDSLKSVTEMTYARKNAGAVLVEGKIFAFGGIGINNTTLKSVERYDPLRKQWVKRTDNKPWADLLQAKSNFAASAVNSQIYIFGGSSVGATIKSCEIYNTKDDQTFNSSELITENNIPDGLIRQDHTAVLVNDKIYIIGGRKWDASLNKFVYLNSIYVFNPDTRNFTLSNYVLNTARSSFGVNVVDDKIYIYGGMTNTGTTDSYLNTVEVLNTLVTPTTQTNCQLLSSPKLVKPRALFGYAAVNGISYVLGGTNGTILDSIEEYKTLDSTISEKKVKLNTTIKDCVAVSAYNKIFIIGGTSNGSNILNQVTEYIPQKLPGLKFPDKYLGRDKAETRKMYINDHVNIVTGNYMEQTQDVKIDSSGIDITLDRTYNSASNSDLSAIGWGIGKGWKFNFQTCIEKLNSTTTYKVKAPHGLNVRKASIQGNCLGLSGQPIISFADGSIVTTVDTSSVVKDGYEWVKIRYENQDCFIAKNYLTRLSADGNKFAVNYPTGSRDVFEETAPNSGKYVAYGNYDKFSYTVESGVDTYKLLNAEDDRLFVYRKRKDNIGRLEEINDKYGNKLFISYSDTVSSGNTTYSNNIKSVYEAVYSNGSTVNGRKIEFAIDTVQINGKDYGMVKRVDIKQPGTVNSWDPNNDVLISSVNYSYFNSTNTTETKWFNTLKSVTDLNGVTTSYGYVKSKEGYLESLTTAGVKKYKITYEDIMGRIVTKTDAVGNTEEYQYNDVVSQESGADVPDSDESNMLSRHYFDKNGKHFVTNYSSTEMKPSKEIYREDNGSNDTVITSNKYEIFYKSKGIWIDLSKVQKGNTDYTNYMNAINEAQNETGNVKVRETTTDIYGNITTTIKDELGYVNTKTLTPYNTSKTIVNEYKYVDYLFESAFSATPNINLKDRNIQYENLKENNKYLSSTKYTYDNNNVKLRYKSELQNLNLMAINQGNWNFDPATLDSDPNIITTESRYYDDDPAYSSYKIKGLIKEIITPLKGKTSYTYEPKDFYNIKSITQAIDTNQNSTKEILRYDWAGRKTLERSPLGYTTQYVYDNTGKLLKTSKSGNGKNSITRVIYDGLGRVVQEISPNLYDTNKDVLNVSANQSSYDDSTVGKRYKYNNDGTVAYVIDPDGSTTYYKYDGNGNVSFEIKPDGSKYSYEYDWKNRKVTVQFADPDSLELYTLKKYSYQTENGINKETETEFFSSDLNYKAVTSRLYDYAGRKIRQDNPDLGIVTATYDALGRVLTQSDANNTLNASQQPVYKYKTYYNYDFDVTNKCRIAEMWEPYRVDNSTTPEIIKYKYSKTIYDNAGRILKTLAENDNVGTTINESDISDYTKSSIRPTSSVAVSTNQYYYNGWLKESVEGISGKRTSFTYNNDGTLLSENRYASIGPDRIYKTEYGSNYLGKVSVENVYINAGEIAYSDSNATTNTNAVILKTEHDYDLNGNVISDISYEKENKTDPTNRIIKTTYGYDKMDRQISKLQYGKKADGNTDISINSVLYNWQGNPVTTTDANGNTTKLEYNSRGFKTRVVSGLSVVGIKDTGSYIESSGFWSDSKYSGYRSEKARKTINSGAKSSWTATLSSEGNYNVYAIYPYDVDNTSNAQYSITASDGNYSITVDQKQNAGTWVLVGTYNFSKSNGKVSAVVSLTSGAGMTHADSIMFEPSVSRETALGVSDSSYKEISATNSWRDAAYAGYKADNARYTSNQGDQAIWNVTLPVEGSYRVLVKYGGDAYNTTNALYTINNSDSSSNINVNQQYNIGKWVSLGTYNIVKGTDGKINASITLTAGIGNTQADAIMFEPRSVNAYSYDLAGRLIAEVSTENYDSTQTDARSMNNRYEYTYDPSGRNLKKLFIGNEKKVILNTLVLSDVYITSYSKTYDKNGNILTECDAGGYNTKYTYTPQNKIETVLDPVNSDNGLAYSKKYVYDTVGRIYIETNCKKASDYDEGKKESVLQYKYDNVLYNGNIQKTKITKSYYNFDPITKVASTPTVLEINTYDLEGNVISRVDGNGYETLFEYNALSKVKKATTSGDITVQSNVTNYYYDMFGNVRKQLYDRKYPNNTKVETVIDISTYDDWGRLTAHTRMNASGSYKITETSGYDRNGNKLFYKDGVQNANTDQNQTNFSYDQYNRLISKTLQVKCYDKDSATGLPFVYSTHTTTNNYDFNGNAIKVTQKIEYKGSSVENSSTFEFDSMNRLVRKGFISNSQSAEKTIQLLEYYWNGNQKKTYEASNNDNPSLFNVTTFEYDKNNRLTKTIDPLGVSDIGNSAHTKSQQYDNNGNVSKKIDGKDQQTIYRYDELNRLIRVETPTKVLEKYSYDRNGNIETKTDGRGLTTKYTYNSINKVATKVDNGGTGVGSRTVEYKYYSDGNLYTTKDRKNQTATFGYDIHGRLTTKVVGNISLGYEYDQNNNIVSAATSSDYFISDFDELGRVIRKSVGYGNGMLETKNIYDVVPTVSDIPSNPFITVDVSGCTAVKSIDNTNNQTLKVYDGEGRLKYVVSNNATTAYEYYRNGSLKSITYPGGTKEKYKYWEDNLLKELTNTKLVNGQDTIVDVYTYYYDGAHNQDYKLELINNQDKGKTDYDFDELNRLKQVKEIALNRTTDYIYDNSGNRKTEVITEGVNNVTTKEYSYSDQNRLLEVTIKYNNVTKNWLGYNYDNNGNVSSVTDAVYNSSGVFVSSTNIINTYNEIDQLTKTVNVDNTILNKYDAEGYRVVKTVTGKTPSNTRYFYENDKVVLEFNESNNTLKARNVYGTNLNSRTIDGQTLYYMYNGHGDVTALTDSAGNVAISYYYDAFGNILDRMISSGYTNFTNSITYAGYQYDSESETKDSSGNTKTGMYYLNSRMYDPVTARFLQEDTYSGDINDPLSLNLYTYCHNEPLMYTDPTGHIAAYINGMSITMDPGNGYDTEYAKYLYSHSNKDDYSKNKKESAYRKDFNRSIAAYELKEIFKEYSKSSVKVGEGLYYDISKGFGRLGTEQTRSKQYYLMQMMLDNEIVLDNPEVAIQIAALLNSGAVMDYRRADIIKKALANDRFFNDVVNEEKEEHDQFVKDIAEGVVETVSGLLETGAGISTYASTPISNAAGIAAGTYLTGNGLSYTAGGISRILNAGTGKGETWNFVRNACNSISSEYGDALYFGTQLPGIAYGGYQVVKSGYQASKSLYNSWKAYKGTNGNVINTAREEIGSFELLPESSLNKRQMKIHQTLKNPYDTALFRKKDVSMNDLRQLTMVTGDEYAVFSGGGRRLVIRGKGNDVWVSDKMLLDIIYDKYGKYTGHTHPMNNSILPGPADRPNLIDMRIKQSAIWGNIGDMNGTNGIYRYGIEPSFDYELNNELRSNFFKKQFSNR